MMLCCMCPDHSPAHDVATWCMLSIYANLNNSLFCEEKKKSWYNFLISFFSLCLTYMSCLYWLALIQNPQLYVAICKPLNQHGATGPNIKQSWLKIPFQCQSAQMYCQRQMCGKTAWPQSSHVRGLTGISFSWHFNSYIIFFALLLSRCYRVLNQILGWGKGCMVYKGTQCTD